MTFNLVFYVYGLWLAVWIYRMAQGKERILVGGFFAAALLGFTNAFVSPSALRAIRFVQAVSMCVAFFAALFILLKAPGFGKSDTTMAKRLLLLLGALLVAALALGALIYFAPWQR